MSAMTDRDFMKSILGKLEEAAASLEEIEHAIFERQRSSDLWMNATLAADAVERCAASAREAVKLHREGK